MQDVRVLSATTMIGDEVKNPQGESIGKLDEIMIDTNSRCIAYAVLSFGGFLGIGDKLFAIPWEALKIDVENECFIFDVTKEKLEEAPGFDKDDWPETPDPEYISCVHNYYGYKPYWEREYSEIRH